MDYLGNRYRNTGGGDRGGVKKIKDQMDDILENRAFFRRHVPQDGDSLYRSICDVMFGTQKLAPMLRRAKDAFVFEGSACFYEDDEDEEGGEGEEGRQRDPQRDVRILAEMLEIDISLIFVSDQNLTVERIYSDGRPDHNLRLAICDEAERPAARAPAPLPARGGDSGGSGVALEEHGQASSVGEGHVFLTYSGCGKGLPFHYSPVYSERYIRHIALAQSVLYECLYSGVFGIADAYDAGRTMLALPEHNKPTFYDRGYEGSAMNAVMNGIMPFPYKVAKVLDPESFRNIEFDAWNCDLRETRRRERDRLRPLSPTPAFSGGTGGGGGNTSGAADSRQRSGSGSRSRPSRTSPRSQRQITIGSLPKGSPCIIRDELYGEVYAEIVGLMPCRKNVHVWMPHFNAYAVVGRKTINPIKNRREDFDYIDYAQQQPQRPLSPMVMNVTGGGGGGGYSDLTAAQGVYEGGGGWVGQQQQQQYQQQQYQQQPQQQEWLPAVLPSFCTCEACLARYCNTQQMFSATESVHRHVADEEAVRQQNIFFMMRGEPGWVERSDFTVPPPSPLLMPLPPLPPVSPSPSSSSGYIFYAPSSPLLTATTPSSPGLPWSPMPPTMPPSPTFSTASIPQQQPTTTTPCSCSICSLYAATSPSSSGIFSSPYSPVSTAPAMTPPGFTAAAAAPTRFVFPPPVELLEPAGLYEYGFQDFPNAAYQDPRNGYQYYNVGQQVLNDGFQFQDQNPFGFMQDVNVGYQVQEDPGNGNQNHSSAGPDVQSNGCDEGLVNGFEDPEELSGDDPMAAYAEASADFAAMATLPDGFEDDEQGDNDDQPEQEILSTADR